MNKNIVQIQELINKKAIKRLREDLQQVSDFIQSNRLTSETNSGIPLLTFDMLKGEGQEKVYQDKKAAYWVFRYELASNGTSVASSPFMDNLYEYWLPVYIQEETQLFFNKVIELRNEVDSLLEREDFE